MWAGRGVTDSLCHLVMMWGVTETPLCHHVTAPLKAQLWSPEPQADTK